MIEWLCAMGITNCDEVMAAINDIRLATTDKIVEYVCNMHNVPPDWPYRYEVCGHISQLYTQEKIFRTERFMQNEHGNKTKVVTWHAT